MPSIPRFIYEQLTVTLPVPEGSYAGKTIIVTGSNIGLGKEAARHFARLGASTLILAVRSVEKGNEAKRDIETTTNCGPAVIQVWPLDMGKYDSVKAFAARANELPRVDIVIENAGVATYDYREAEGGEETIVVNVISTFLLAALVLPKLKETAREFGVRPALTITASEVHSWAKFPERNAPEGKIFDTLLDKSNWGQMKNDRYMVSKLLEVLAVQAIGEKYPAATYPVTVNCLNPGLCRSGLIRDLPSIVGLIQRPISRTTEQGSRTLVHAGSQAAITGGESHGKYLSNCRIQPSEGLAQGPGSKELQDRVWNELMQRLETIQPGVTANF
ncbi:hypothetical protein jhhlp_000615 [Lomentospora prolificans]|uniref:Ketoreductase (KR) domain-containing protein n=1 Tax=Lomentospora prolificans TaxID=41688 RepID=A0A2N3NJ37_9PEZI|nr:hypothetical protein jhhlp_000615 [Lomentospora prolificans]